MADDKIATPKNKDNDTNRYPIEPSVNTDGKNKGQWKSIYPSEARAQIKKELWYVVILLIISLVIIYLNWVGLFSSTLQNQFQKATLTTYTYYLASGLLGGVTFGGKYLYRIVGRGYWNQDRWVWRAFSPMISMVLGFIIGAMVECGAVESIGHSSGARCIVIGFLAGYFADEAVGFMCDIAGVVFRKRD